MQMCQLVGFLTRLSLWVFPGPGSDALVRFVQTLWPVGFVILALLGALARLCLIYFSRSTPLVRRQPPYV
jgi:hypothetical protein